MDLRERLKGRLRLPLIGSPLFIISVPELVVAQCCAGVIGSMPSLNARPLSQLDEWLSEIAERLAAHDRANPERPSAPFAINLIVHKSNDRLEDDLALCVKHRVPVIISSLGAREDVNAAIHSYGGHVLHDVINQRFAHKAIEKGADGLVLVAAGAGGHAGAQSPFALVQETRAWFGGPLALSGSIAHGRSILAAEAMGRRLRLYGLRLHRHRGGRGRRIYKAMLVEAGAEDIVYTNLITGVHGNYLKPRSATPAWTRTTWTVRQLGHVLRVRPQEEVEGHLGGGRACPHHAVLPAGAWWRAARRIPGARAAWAGPRPW
jgi:nitronate monooxygenase